jgi:dihydrofolate reductase
VHADMVHAAAGRNVWLVGGGELVGQFADAGLLEEIIAGVTPVTLGGGAPLLPRRLTGLQLVGTEVVGGSFVELRYAVPGGNSP